MADKAGEKQRPPGDIAMDAAKVLHQLTGRRVEGVTGVERHDDGWKVNVEVVELQRIPESADLLGLYEVELDAKGDLAGYRRLRRYGRGHGGDDPS